MKRIAITAVAALMLAGPLASTADAQSYGQRQHQDRDRDRDGRNDNDLRDNTREYRREHQRTRWSQSQHNGYYANGRFYYGPPSQAMQRRSDYRPAWQNWRRGERLPAYYRSHYRGIDYRREHLRAPPRGYHYVRDDRGELLLVGIATGVILSILANQ